MSQATDKTTATATTTTAPAKPAPKAATKPAKKGYKQSISAMVMIICCGIVAFTFFFGICGAKFVEEEMVPTMFRTLYEGGFVIPIVMTLLLTVLALGVERYIALNKASGRGKIVTFVANAKKELATGNIEATQALCDKQRGAVANILRAGLVRYRDVAKRDDLSNDDKAKVIEKEIEDATSLELPYLEQNLNVIATISSLGTLFGLLGTVLGMIRSFAAMANEGAPDSIALSLGISEALMNTAMGIATGALAIIVYNFFAAKVQDITNAVNEVGFAVGQTYATK
jgi:biopolymer transport protein ExbB